MTLAGCSRDFTPWLLGRHPTLDQSFEALDLQT
jgi:hypothetical protein